MKMSRHHLKHTQKKVMKSAYRENSSMVQPTEETKGAIVNRRPKPTKPIVAKRRLNPLKA